MWCFTCRFLWHARAKACAESCLCHPGAEDRAHAAQPVQGVLCCKAIHASHRLLLWSCIQPAASQLLHGTGSACSYAGVVTHVDANVELGQEEWQQFRKDQMTLQEQVDKFRSLIYVGGSNEIVAGTVTCVVARDCPAGKSTQARRPGYVLHSGCLVALTLL